MKKNIIVLCMVVSSASSLATIRTVSNDPAIPAQFTTFAAAQAASVVGDTIYLQGTSFQYPAMTVTKRLVIIGSGHMPASGTVLSTKVASINLSRNATDNASGSTLMGLLVAGSVSPSGGSFTVPNNISITRNRIEGNLSLSPGSCGGTYPSGWVIANNIFLGRIDGGGNPGCGSATNTLIANNIFSRGNINGFSSVTVVIDHNLFIGITGGSMIAGLSSVVVTNNIFSRSTGFVFDPSASIVFCSFNNNLSNLSTIASSPTYNPGNDFANFVASLNGSNTGSGNIIGQNPLFTTNTNPDVFNALDDYRLQASSPGKNAATDGMDIGIYGGSFPFPTGGAPGSGFDTSAVPAVPQVTNVNIQNSTLAPGGQLRVTIQATVNN
jgi:hypothetical protein